MRNTKTFSPNSHANSYSFLYRLIDLSVLICSLPFVAMFYGTSIDREYLVAALTVSVIFLYMAESMALYRSWRVGRLSQMVLISWGCICVSFFALLALSFLFKESESFSRVIMVLWFVSTLLGSLLWRAAQRQYIKSRRRAGHNIKKVAIVGATEVGESLLGEIMSRDELGFKMMGIYEDRHPDRAFGDLSNKIKGKVQAAIKMARDGELDTLFIALPLKADRRIADILRLVGDTTVDVHIIPDFLMSNLVHARIGHVGEIDTLSVFESPYLGAKQWLKRSEDVVVGTLILALILVPMLFIAAGIKLTSKGPVLFKQRRYGLRGEEIEVWKFRSMTVMENSDVVVQATKSDVRITPFGGFLRRTSLDELPQFFNVLGGSMSIVGPRPHAVAHNEEYRSQVQFYMLRHKVKPGITGWAQINGWRGETDTLYKMEKRVEFDLQYIKHWSVWFDIKIIFMTIFKGFVNKNAY
ncbi:MAG: undecaprenyl-phosphate glucose phosphotransferase [Gammaproteobacteria bacterium]|nr:undecaprenyl-phosphate glucose phosphotransferase [Gammaproteobacteria bacterium]